MMNVWESAKSFYRKNGWFAVLCGVQLCAVLYCIAWLCTPAQQYELSLQELFAQTEEDAVTLQDDGALFLHGETDEATTLTVYSGYYNLLSFARGAYKVTVVTAFEAPAAGQAISLEEQYASVGIASISNYWQLEMEEIALRKGVTQTTGRLWVLGQGRDDFCVKITCNAGADLYIESITLTEQVAWRYLVFVGMLALFAAMDALYLLLFARGAAFVQAFVSRHKAHIALGGSILVASLPSLTNFAYSGHDIYFHLSRIGAIAAELAGGQFPVRMLTAMLNGYGYATPVFYCDIFLYLPAFLYNCMMPLSLAYQVYLVTVNIATGIVAYCCCAKIFKSRFLGWFGATLYLLAAYRLVNLYTRAAVGEYTAMVFFPLLIYGIYAMYTTEKPTAKQWLPVALAMAGIVQCHLVSSELSVILIAIFCVFYYKKTFTLPRIQAWAFAALTCLGLSAWFVIPFAEYMLSVEVWANTSLTGHVQDMGLYLVQLVSLFGTVGGVTESASTLNEMPLGLGWSLLVGAGAAVYCLVKRNAWKLEGTSDMKKLRCFFGFAVLATLFTCRAFPWNAIADALGEPLNILVQSVQFTWRYLAFATVFFVFTSLAALAILQKKNAKAYRIAWVGMLIALALSAGVYQSMVMNSAAPVQMPSAQGNMNAIMSKEYLLNGAQSETTETLQFGDNTAVVVQYYATVQSEKELTCVNTTGSAQTVAFPVYAYLYYQVTDKATGELFAITASDTQTIQVTLPAYYEGTLVLSYQAPLLWRLAEGITMLSWLWLLAWVVFEYDILRSYRKWRWTRNIK